MVHSTHPTLGHRVFWSGTLEVDRKDGRYEYLQEVYACAVENIVQSPCLVLVVGFIPNGGKHKGTLQIMSFFARRTC